MFFGAREIRELPDRQELGASVGRLRFAPVEFPAKAFSSLHLEGAWQVTSEDPRFGGVSALALRGGWFTALTDSGVVIRFARPNGASAHAEFRELPDGPGSAAFKSSRDSEAVVADPGGRGWWVAFENHHSLWLYDPDFGRAQAHTDFPRRRWKRNRGLEGLAAEGDALLLFPEDGRAAIRLHGERARRIPIDGGGGRISEAARLPSGQLAVIHRSLTPFGFRNRLSIFQPTANGFRTVISYKLGLSALDNVEALAPERLPGGGTRLWMMTDDNFLRPLRTLLIAVDLP